MQTVSEINNYPEPKFRHFWRHLASAINRFFTASQFRYFSIATRFRHFWRHLASAIRRFLTASQFRYFTIATRFLTFVTPSSELSLKLVRPKIVRPKIVRLKILRPKIPVS